MLQVNIKSRQLSAVERMLRLEQPGGGGPGGQQWKVLVYDEFCRDIISPLITVGRLRENGVTLHMLLKSPRESIPDVPAVYFIQPTAENIGTFVQDCQKQLYDTAYVNFVSPIPRELMEMLAKRLVEVNAVNVIAKVYDQYLGFVSLEPKLFTLNLKNSFARYNIPTLPDMEIKRCMDEIALGATSMVATLGVVPIIRCPPGGPAEMVARQIQENVRRLLEEQSGFFSQGMGRGVLDQRPMLLVVDRSVDMTAPLMHTSGYQSLVDDLLDVGLNRVKVPPPVKKDAQGNVIPSNEPAKTIPLDKESDVFWEKYAGSVISAAVEAHSKELKDVERQEEEIKQKTGKDASTLGNMDSNGDTSALLSTVQSLPALLEKKKHLERHLSLLKATMDVISKRQVHRFVEPEESMVYSKYVEKQSVMELAADPALSLEDKVRMFAVYLLSTSPSQQDADEIEGAIMASGEQDESLLKTVRYVKKILSLTRFGKGGGDHSPPRPGAAGSGGLWDLAGMTRSAFQNASRQVKSMVGSSKVSACVRMMHLACKETTGESQIAEQDAQLLYFDPKVNGDIPANARVRSAFTRGILFVVGGGCISEYQNLQDYAAGRVSMSSASAALRLGDSSGLGGSGKESQFIYGCSELVNAKRFMQQLAECAN